MQYKHRKVDVTALSQGIDEKQKSFQLQRAENYVHQMSANTLCSNMLLQPNKVQGFQQQQQQQHDFSLHKVNEYSIWLLFHLSSNRICTREHKKKETEKKERASLNSHTHLQVKLCRGQSVSSSGGGSGGRCPWQVPRSGAGGGRGPLERGMGMGSAEGGRHRGISLLPHLLLHLEEKQRNTGVSERKRRVILLDTQ